MRSALCRPGWIPLLVLLALLAVEPVTAGVNRWTPFGPGSASFDSLVADPNTPGTLYVLAARRTGFDFEDVRNEVYKSTDGGRSWVWSNRGLEKEDVASLVADPAHPGVLLAGTRLARLYRTADGGQTWQAVLIKQWNAPLVFVLEGLTKAPGDAPTLFLKGHPYYTVGPYHLLRSPDGGETVTSVLSSSHPLGDPVIDPKDPRKVYIATKDVPSGILASSDGGTTWDAVPESPETAGGAIPLLVAPTQPSTLFVHSRAGLYRSTNGGASWAPAGQEAGGLRGPMTVDPGPPLTLYATSGTGIAASTDGGATWAVTPQSFPLGKTFELAASRHAAYVLSRVVFRTDDGGRTWTAGGTRGLQGAFADMIFAPSDPSRVYVLYDFASPSFWYTDIWESQDGGQTWSAVGEPQVAEYWFLKVDRGSHCTSTSRRAMVPSGAWTEGVAGAACKGCRMAPSCCRWIGTGFSPATAGSGGAPTVGRPGRRPSPARAPTTASAP